MTTIETLTLDQVTTLNREAATAGDTATALDCAALERRCNELDLDPESAVSFDERLAPIAERIVSVIRNAEAQS